MDNIETSNLGDRSCLATDGQVAAVAGPQRDIGRVLTLVDAEGLQVTHVPEANIHNDYLTGELELAARKGAVYVLPVDSTPDLSRGLARRGT